MTIEVCANSLSSALIAQKTGVHRVELCQNLWCGGTTPSAATIALSRQQLSIDLFVLIRPRSGDFCYSNMEFEVIKQDILYCKKHRIDGVVIGLLNIDGTIDLERTTHLLELANPMQVTFHRAFDFVQNPLEALEQLIDIGVHRILTSGFQASAWEGRAAIRQLIEAADNRLAILAGGGINPQNVQALIAETGVQEIHLSGKQLIKSPFQKAQLSLNQKGIPELDYLESDESTLREMMKMLDK